MNELPAKAEAAPFQHTDIFRDDRYLLDSGRYNWLWFLCCLGIVMNNLLQSYGIDGHSLLG